MNYKVKESNKIFSGRVFDIQVDKLIYNSGNDGIREIVIHYGGAVVVPVNDDGSIILVRQFRYPLQKFLYELPAGKLDKDEDPLECARRELKEETGFSCGDIVKLGSIFTTPGFCTEELHIFLAEKLVDGDHEREEGEYGMEIHSFTPDQLDKMIITGEIKDAKTISGIYMYKKYSGR
ncbi:MAG: NUDIX hydrolase [Melioribacteraceae bacterium]|nr:NUDIX hydrolase [Melioribacteraceae bacterium]